MKKEGKINMQEEMRQKYWSEINSDEKTERMRQEVKFLKGAVVHLESLIQKLTIHRHLPNGEIVCNIRELGYYDQPARIGESFNSDEEYF